MKTTIFALAFGFLSMATANAGVLTCIGQRGSQMAPEKIMATVVATAAVDLEKTTPVAVSVVSDISTGPTLRKNPGTLTGSFGESPVKVEFLGGKMDLEMDFNRGAVTGSVTLDGQESIPLICVI